ncbi:DUF3341 domain-containing protein [Blattabacterium cuenoti]|uniref:DUF3341 domain-containing protein n=1 Tax=Blattabacterium cuenoti TaxID=1653831 RepID=UPI00163C98F0|nr:DUF3341 domain-containing protein [Blattabacterium cuenoti]
MNHYMFYIQILYDNENLLVNSIQNLLNKKKKNVKIHNVYSPYPIHHMEKLIHLKETKLSFLSFLYGLLGFSIASILTWYTMIFDWPQNIGGKPSYSWIQNVPSFIPVIFEVSIFFSAHFMCITYLIQCKLFPGSISKNPDKRTTDNMFLIEIYSEQEQKVKELTYFFKQNGAKEINIKKIQNV